jgi:hypothetical protein
MVCFSDHPASRVPNLRHVTIDQAIYRVLVDEHALTVRILRNFGRPGPRPRNACKALATAVMARLGHTKLESTVRYLGVEVDDALSISERESR